MLYCWTWRCCSYRAERVLWAGAVYSSLSWRQGHPNHRGSVRSGLARPLSPGRLRLRRLFRWRRRLHRRKVYRSPIMSTAGSRQVHETSCRQVSAGVQRISLRRLQVHWWYLCAHIAVQLKTFGHLPYRYPYSQICEITRNFQDIWTQMGNNPVGKMLIPLK